MFIFGTLSALWSINFDFTVSKWLLWLIAAFSFVLALNLSTTHENLVKLAWGLIIAAGTIAFIGLLQYYFARHTLRDFHKTAEQRTSFQQKIAPAARHTVLYIF